MIGIDARASVRRGSAAILAAVVIGLAPARPAGATVLFNVDFQNNTGQKANDFHIQLQGPQPIDVTNTIATTVPNQPGAAFPSSSTQNNNTKSVSINWTGATLNKGDWTHVGAVVDGTGNGLKATEAYWTKDGKSIGNVPLASINFTPASTYDIVVITLYNTANDVIGHEWVEGLGNGFGLFNGLQTPLRFSDAKFFFSDTLIPLDQLNENYLPPTDSRFLPANPSSGTLPPSPEPEPSTLALAAFGVATLITKAAARRRRDR